MRTSDIRICNDHLATQNKGASAINAYYVTQSTVVFDKC